MEHKDFWVTIATVLPVFGLALLLVARAEVARSLTLPRFALALDAILFGATLIQLALSEFISLLILSGEIQETANWRALARSAATWSILVLFMTPLVNLLRMALWRPMVTREGRRALKDIRRSMRSRKRDLRAHRKKLRSQFQQMTDKLEEMASDLREEPFNPRAPISTMVERREWLRSYAWEVEHTVAEGEEGIRKSEGALVKSKESQDDLMMEVRKRQFQFLWSLFSSSIGHSEPQENVNDGDTTSESAPKTLVARPPD